MLHRWVGRPALELGYLVAGLFTGVVTFTVAVTMLALSLGLLPVFLLGIPVFVATIFVPLFFTLFARRQKMGEEDAPAPAATPREATP